MTNPTATLAYAAAQVGYHEGHDPNGNWNNHEKFAAIAGLEWVDQTEAPWCATFVYACAVKGKVANLYPQTASTDVAAAWWRAHGRWSDKPSVGAQALFGHDGNMDHTGLVVDFDDTYIHTIEGNSNDNGSSEGDGVYRQTRLRRSDVVQGYGHPAFTEPVRSADPKFGKPAKAVMPKPVHEPTRVEQAHDLLDKAAQVAKSHGHDHRAETISGADDELPKR